MSYEEYIGRLVFVKALDHATYYNIDDLGVITGSKDYLVCIGRLDEVDDKYLYITYFYKTSSDENENIQKSGLKIMKETIVEFKEVKI